MRIAEGKKRCAPLGEAAAPDEPPSLLEARLLDRHRMSLMRAVWSLLAVNTRLLSAGLTCTETTCTARALAHFAAKLQ